jgi:hypothetical protein
MATDPLSEGAPSPAPAAPEPAPHPDDNAMRGGYPNRDYRATDFLEQSLAEFDAANPPPATDGDAELTPQQTEAELWYSQQTQVASELAQHRDAIAAREQALIQQETLARDQRDYDGVKKMAREASPDLAALSDSALDLLFGGAYVSRPEVARAWDNRHRDAFTWQRHLHKLVHEFSEGIMARRADPVATADREAVANFVRGNRTAPPESPPLRLGELNDADFAKVKKGFGIE